MAVSSEPVTGADAITEIISRLKPIIDHLPEKYKQAITMTEFGSLTRQEMAENLGLSLSGAKARVQRARAKLKGMLLTCCHFEFDRLGNIIEYGSQVKSCSQCCGNSS